MLVVSLRTVKLRSRGHQPVTYGYVKSFESISKHKSSPRKCQTTLVLPMACLVFRHS